MDAAFSVFTHIKEELGKQALGKDESLFQNMVPCLLAFQDGPGLFGPFMTTGWETETRSDSIFQNKCRISLRRMNISWMVRRRHLS